MERTSSSAPIPPFTYTEACDFRGTCSTNGEFLIGGWRPLLPQPDSAYGIIHTLILKSRVLRRRTPY